MSGPSPRGLRLARILWPSLALGLVVFRPASALAPSSEAPWARASIEEVTMPSQHDLDWLRQQLDGIDAFLRDLVAILRSGACWPEFGSSGEVRPNWGSKRGQATIRLFRKE